MKPVYLIFVLLASVSLVACEQEKKDESQPKLFQDQRTALDKAKGVEDTLKQQAEAQQQATDRQSQ